MLRSGLVLSTVLAGVLLAGCGSGAGTTPTPTAPGTEPPAGETSSAYPPRTSGAKSLEIGDQCSMVTAEQATALGADQAPKVGESNGKPGCDYLQGEAGGGFMVFVAANKAETMQKFANARKSKVQMMDIGGYPTAQVGDDKSCLLSVDVADQGSLYINTLVSNGQHDPCDLSKRFAETALQNLPNA